MRESGGKVEMRHRVVSILQFAGLAKLVLGSDEEAVARLSGVS
jgi:hypothetical protein